MTEDVSGVVLRVCDDSMFGTDRASFGGDGGLRPGIRDESSFFEIVTAASDLLGWRGSVIM